MCSDSMLFHLFSKEIHSTEKAHYATIGFNRHSTTFRFKNTRLDSSKCDLVDPN